MATEPRDPEAEARDLRAELGRLKDDLRRVQGFDIETDRVTPLDKFRVTSRQPPPKDSPAEQREAGQLDARIQLIEARLAELAGQPDRAAPPRKAGRKARAWR